MNAILTPGCACARAWVTAGAAATSPIHAHTVTTRLITVSPRESCRSSSRAPARAPRSEEVAQLEAELEARCRPSEGVGAVEAVRPVDADGAERCDDAQAQPSAPEQASRADLPGLAPHDPGEEAQRPVLH